MLTGRVRTSILLLFLVGNHWLFRSWKLSCLLPGFHIRLELYHRWNPVTVIRWTLASLEYLACVLARAHTSIYLLIAVDFGAHSNHSNH